LDSYSEREKGFENGRGGSQAVDIAEKGLASGGDERVGTAICEGYGQSEANPVAVDPVSAAFADALRAASLAGEWSTVEQLARMLEARRAASFLSKTRQ